MIALDAMGGDSAPQTPVAGAIAAAHRSIPIVLYGDEAVLVSHLNACWARWRSLPITVVHCSQTISMSDVPSRAVLRKKDSSLVRAMYDLAAGSVSAVVSAGNSGAAVVAATLLLGRMKGVSRPALGEFFPTPNGKIFCLDLGANSDVRPELLHQFAQLGSLYVRQVGGCKRPPRIALISNGSEPGKGSMLVKKAYELLRHDQTINFVGNLEPRELFQGYADVAVTDGFTGNIMLKTVQGTVRAVHQWLRTFARQSVINRLSLLASRSLFTQLKEQIDYARVGGGLLLGVRHPCVIAHGSSSSEAIMQALLKADKIARSGTVTQLEQAWAQQYGVGVTQLVRQSLSAL